MEEIVSKLICLDCKQELPENAKVCPYCKSPQLKWSITVRTTLSFGISDEMKIKNFLYPCRKRLRYDAKYGNVLSQMTDNGRANIERIIDKDNNRYYEHVEDCNGTIIHHCEESLSEHYGHGSAKNTIDNSHKPD